MTPAAVLDSLWQHAGLPGAALAFARLTGDEPVFPSSLRVGTAAQTSIAAAALAACELGFLRGVPRQQVAVPMEHASVETTGWFALDGRAPELWDKFSGLYRSADGWVRIHANFAHHRDGALRLLGLGPAVATRADAQAAMLLWKAIDFETAASDAGLVATALRSFGQWDATPHAQALVQQPLFAIERIGDAAPLSMPPLSAQQRPLEGVKLVELTRILAGPVAGRALASHGADVMLVNALHLPNIGAIADTSRGKRSAHIDLRQSVGRETMDALLSQAHVFMQGYRPGGLQALGYGPADVASRRPGIVYVSLSAYGDRGPWAARRGFDSLLQTAMGFNHAEGEAAGDDKPRPMPMQILDEATGFLMAFATCAALWRQQREGGSWHVRLSLAQTAQWLRGLGRVENGLAARPPSRLPYLETTASSFGELTAIAPSAQLQRTPARYSSPSVRPGESPPHW